jgi:NADH-quinone oxidoreductase subunit G
VSLELRASAVTDRADVVFPVAAVAEKAGTFVNWEGRGGTFEEALPVPEVRTDLYVLGAIADLMDVHLGLPDQASARAELAQLGIWRGTRAEPPTPAGGPQGVWGEGSPQTQGRLGGSSPRQAQFLGIGGAVTAARLATWHQLIDGGRMLDGEPFLAGTARSAVARMSAATAAQAGISDGDKVTIAVASGAAGPVTLAAEVTSMVDGVVWVPAGAGGSDTGPWAHGATVTLRRPQ